MTEAIPPEGTPVRLVLQLVGNKKPPADATLKAEAEKSFLDIASEPKAAVAPK
jgi:hypothetical protein